MTKGVTSILNQNYLFLQGCGLD